MQLDMDWTARKWGVQALPSIGRNVELKNPLGMYLASHKRASRSKDESSYDCFYQEIDLRRL
jgi:hypothetical protein